MEFEIWLKIKTEKIEQKLAEYAKVENNPQEIIYEAMSYSLLAGGKRLRPVLMMAVYAMFSDDEDKILPFACAMEMIHTYSLIHDDLPAMDDDDYRRGKLSNHKKFGEAAAILAGDALLNKAFEIGLTGILDSDFDRERAVRALYIIAKSSGTEGMIGGQVVDIFNQNINTTDELIYMYSHKTCAIIKSSVATGAILGGADERQIKAIESYAENLGIAFQIKDDLLDIEGTQDKLGKPIGSDGGNNKKTYIALEGVQKSKKDVIEFTSKAEKSLDIFGKKADYLVKLARYLIGREY